MLQQSHCNHLSSNVLPLGPNIHVIIAIRRISVGRIEGVRTSLSKDRTVNVLLDEDSWGRRLDGLRHRSGRRWHSFGSLAWRCTTTRGSPEQEISGTLHGETTTTAGLSKIEVSTRVPALRCLLGFDRPDRLRCDPFAASAFHTAPAWEAPFSEAASRDTTRTRVVTLKIQTHDCVNAAPQVFDPP